MSNESIGRLPPSPVFRLHELLIARSEKSISRRRTEKPIRRQEPRRSFGEKMEALAWVRVCMQQEDARRG